MPMSASRIFFARCSSKGWWGNVDHHYLLPLTQVELGDALGISEVYANRMLRRVQDEKLIVSERRTMRIPDLEALSRRIRPRYLHLDGALQAVRDTLSAPRRMS